MLRIGPFVTQACRGNDTWHKNYSDKPADCPMAKELKVKASIDGFRGHGQQLSKLQASTFVCCTHLSFEKALSSCNSSMCLQLNYLKLCTQVLLPQVNIILCAHNVCC